MSAPRYLSGWLARRQEARRKPDALIVGDLARINRAPVGLAINLRGSDDYAREAYGLLKQMAGSLEHCETILARQDALIREVSDGGSAMRIEGFDPEGQFPLMTQGGNRD